MSTNGKSYAELGPDAQLTALKSFIAFYVRQYKKGSLEILSAKVSNEVISSINEILNQNQFMGHAEFGAVEHGEQEAESLDGFFGAGGFKLWDRQVWNGVDGHGAAGLKGVGAGG